MCFYIAQFSLKTARVWTIVESLITLFSDMVFKIEVWYWSLGAVRKGTSKIGLLKNVFGYKGDIELFQRTDCAFAITQVAKCLSLLDTWIAKEFLSTNTTIVSSYGYLTAKWTCWNNLCEEFRRRSRVEINDFCLNVVEIVINLHLFLILMGL